MWFTNTSNTIWCFTKRSPKDGLTPPFSITITHTPQRIPPVLHPNRQCQSVLFGTIWYLLVFLGTFWYIYDLLSTFGYFLEAHLNSSLLFSLNADSVREVVMRRKSVAWMIFLYLISSVQTQTESKKNSCATTFFLTILFVIKGQGNSCLGSSRPPSSWCGFHAPDVYLYILSIKTLLSVRQRPFSCKPEPTKSLLF